MNKTERNILQALYLREPRPGHWHAYPYEAIRWLDGKSRSQVSAWISQEGRFQTWNPGVAHAEGQTTDLNSHLFIMRWLKYLAGKGYLEISGEADMDLRLTLTADGVEIARLCTSRFGRAELWYRQNRAGLLGLALTVVVAIITSSITTCAAR